MSDGRVYYERRDSERDGVNYRCFLRLGHVTPSLWPRRLRVRTPAWRSPNEDGEERIQAPMKSSEGHYHPAPVENVSRETIT